VFVTGGLFHPRVIFTGKARSVLKHISKYFIPQLIKALKEV
jgi:hypothetical protein